MSGFMLHGLGDCTPERHCGCLDIPAMTAPEPTRPADEHTDAVALDLDAIEAAALANDGWWSVPAFALVAEVRRLAALCIPLTDLAQELDLSRQNLHHSRAMSSAHFERAEREKARAESAEAEVGTLRDTLARRTDSHTQLVRENEALRAKVAAVEAHPVVIELAEERTRQTAKHGDQSHLPDGSGATLWMSMDDDYIRRHGIRRDNLAAWAKSRTDAASQSQGDGSITFEHILTEEWAEAIAESDPDALRAELVQVAAVAVQWIEALDLRAALATGEGK